MNLLVPLTMFGWIPAVLGLFAVLPPRRAVITSFIFAWLFLPMAGYQIQGLPDYTKMTATCFGLMLGIIIFDADRLLSFRPGRMDLPMCIWCLCPFASSVTNGLGVYDGVSSAVNQTVTWGLPYLIGRLYFADLAGLRELATGIFYGGLLYIPFCVFELLFAPILHYNIYGFYQHSFAQHVRMGGFRPMVFMQHGLMVGMWMGMAALSGLWLWRTGGLRRLGVFGPVLVAALAFTAVACKSVNAIMLTALGMGVLWLCRSRRSAWPLLALPVLICVYMAGRLSDSLPTEPIVGVVRTLTNEERTQSFESRLAQEDLFGEKALRRPVFGWAGWGRIFPTDEVGKWLTRGVDSMWVVVLSTNGMVGLGAVYLTLLLPVVLLSMRYSHQLCCCARLSGVAILAVILTLWAIDDLSNAMINPIYILAVGAMSGVAAQKQLAADLIGRQTVRSLRSAVPKRLKRKCATPRRVLRYSNGL